MYLQNGWKRKSSLNENLFFQLYTLSSKLYPCHSITHLVDRTAEFWTNVASRLASLFWSQKTEENRKVHLGEIQTNQINWNAAVWKTHFRIWNWMLYLSNQRDTFCNFPLKLWSNWKLNYSLFPFIYHWYISIDISLIYIRQFCIILTKLVKAREIRNQNENLML